MKKLKALLFDLDETLYRPETGMLPAGDRLITEYLCRLRGLNWEEGDRMRVQMTEQYGTTAAGAEAEFDIGQQQFYADTVELVDPTDHLQPDPALHQALGSIPLPLYILTNATAPYAEAVLAALDLADRFEAIFTVESSGWCPKPAPQAYQAVLAHLDLPAQVVGLVEDNPANLVPARQMGMVTFLLRVQHPAADYVLDDLLELPEVLSHHNLCADHADCGE